MVASAALYNIDNYAKEEYSYSGEKLKLVHLLNRAVDFRDAVDSSMNPVAKRSYRLMWEADFVV